ncbi:acyl-CoA dehydrogenase family protein [Streptomyces sp. NPDC057690]|uniref:acyl-CoA dehydrogenase family protein n=1 Tax=Streptomyces sp. NPDC057690 TaxID=3346214 RepID=UPI0036874BED
MDFVFTAAQDAFRKDIRAELAAPGIRAELDRLALSGDREPDVRPLYRALGRRGLLAVNWPSQYGGRDTGLVEASIVAEELVRAGVPDTLHVNTIQIVGLFLLLAGSPDLRSRRLPDLAAGRRFASVLYTEPEAGSDLAGLRTTAVREASGDGYLLHGVKAYSLKSDITDLALCAARTGGTGGTEDRYQGISLFLVDLHAPGVRRETIPGIADEQFHRVVLDGVRVPAADRVGAEGAGWPLLTSALAIERTGLDYALKAERWYAAALDGGLEPDELVEAGRYGAAVEAARLLSWRVIGQLAGGLDAVDDSLAAAAKLLTSELAQSVAGWTARLPTPAGAPRRHAAGMLEAAYREAPGLTLSAGTSEVMLQIIAVGDTDGIGHPDEEPLLRQVRGEVRRRLRQATADRDRDPVTAVHGPPAAHDDRCPAWPALVELGAPGFEVPAEAGGLDLGLAGSLAVCEELGRAGLSGPYRGVAFTADVLRTAGPDGAGWEALSRLAAGEITVDCGDFALERPLRTRAATDVAPDDDVRPGDARSDGLRSDSGRLVDGPVALDGSGAGQLLLPVHVDGVTALALVPADRPGRRAERIGPDTVVTLEGLRIEPSDIVCRPSDADRRALTARHRIRQAGYLLGLSRGGLVAARAHTAERQQFGVPLHDFQSIAFRLAETAARLELVRLAVYRAAWLADEGRSAERAAVDALGLAAEAVARTTAVAVHVCGTRGLTAQLPVQRYYRLARGEAVRLGAPGRLWREAARLRLAGRDDLEMLTRPTLTEPGGRPPRDRNTQWTGGPQ